MSARADYVRADDGTLRFRGNLSLSQLGNLPDRLNAEDVGVRRLDLSGVDRIDTVGAWIIHRFAHLCWAAVEVRS